MVAEGRIYDFEEGKLREFSGDWKENKKKNIKELITEECDRLRSIPGLGKYIMDLPVMIYMIEDYRNGTYKEVPHATIIMATVAVTWLSLPIDYIPDKFFFAGKATDFVVVGAALLTIHNDLMRYVEWKNAVDYCEEERI